MVEENLGWFTRTEKGINTETKDKKDIKEGMWYKCPKCSEVVTNQEQEERLGVCKCGHHERISYLYFFI